MDENNKFDVVGTNIAEKATMIWNVADMLRGPFKPHMVHLKMELYMARKMVFTVRVRFLIQRNLDIRRL